MDNTFSTTLCGWEAQKLLLLTFIFTEVFMVLPLAFPTQHSCISSDYPPQRYHNPTTTDSNEIHRTGNSGKSQIPWSPWTCVLFCVPILFPVFDNLIGSLCDIVDYVLEMLQKTCICAVIFFGCILVKKKFFIEIFELKNLYLDMLSWANMKANVNLLVFVYEWIIEEGTLWPKIYNCPIIP